MSAPARSPEADADWRRLPPAVPLTLSFDAARLAAEVAALSDLAWRPNRPVHQGGLGDEDTFDWKIIPLRGPTGDVLRTDPGGAGLEDHLDTPVLARCPYHAEVLSTIPAPLHSARLMALGAGAETHEHSDGRTNFPWGFLRLHIPIVTQSGAELVLMERRTTGKPAGSGTRTSTASTGQKTGGRNAGYISWWTPSPPFPSCGSSRTNTVPGCHGAMYYWPGNLYRCNPSSRKGSPVKSTSLRTSPTGRTTPGRARMRSVEVLVLASAEGTSEVGKRIGPIRVFLTG